MIEILLHASIASTFIVRELKSEAIINFYLIIL